MNQTEAVRMEACRIISELRSKYGEESLRSLEAAILQPPQEYQAIRSFQISEIFNKVPVDSLAVEMPIGAKIIRVGLHRGVPTIWAIIDPNVNRTERRTFLIAGTGSCVTSSKFRRHVGTIESELEIHLFDVTEPVNRGLETGPIEFAD